MLKKWWNFHRENVFVWIVKNKLRFNRGANWTGFFTGIGTNILLYVGMFSIIFPNLSGKSKIGLVFISLLVFWIQWRIGLWDEKRGMWKKENNYIAQELQDWVKDIQDDLKKIKDKLDII